MITCSGEARRRSAVSIFQPDFLAPLYNGQRKMDFEEQLTQVYTTAAYYVRIR